MTLLTILLALLGVLLVTAVTLVGAWIDGRRQALRKRGLRPVTTSSGEVVPDPSQRPSAHP